MDARARASVIETNAMRLETTLACALISALAIGCYDSNTDADGGIVLMVDGAPLPPPRDAGPPMPARDGGPAPVPTDAAVGPTRAGAVGSGCETDADCTEPAGARCETSFGGGGFGVELPGGYCTADCEGPGDTSCGAGSECFSVGFGGFGFSLCVKACDSNDDCRADEGYTCMAPPIGGDGSLYCLPPRPSRPDGGFTLPDASFPFDAGPAPTDAGDPIDGGPVLDGGPAPTVDAGDDAAAP